MGNIRWSVCTLFLGIVISNLSEQVSHVPFRDSKLTRILQSSLGGNSRTAFICNVTPAVAYTETTLSTLRIAMRAQRVQNNAQVNEVESMMHLHADKIIELKEKLNMWKRESKEQQEMHKSLQKKQKLLEMQLHHYKTLYIHSLSIAAQRQTIGVRAYEKYVHSHES